MQDECVDRPLVVVTVRWGFSVDEIIQMHSCFCVILVAVLLGFCMVIGWTGFIFFSATADPNQDLNGTPHTLSC